METSDQDHPSRAITRADLQPDDVRGEPSVRPGKPRGRVVTGMVCLFLFVVLARLVIAALVPIVQDEAYYIEWSKSLDWGYFDHPPRGDGC